MRIIFIGTPDFAVGCLKALVENGFNVVAVITAPDKPAGRGKTLTPSAVKLYAIEQNLPILQPEKLKNPEFLKELKSYNADLQVVVAFRMLPEAVWNMPPMGTINVHGSLLPQYRGAAPINYAIINGESETGVTTFKLKHQIDTGNILLQQKVPILPEDNFGTLYQKLMHEGAKLLVKTLQGIKDGSIQEQEQVFDENLKQAPKIFKEDCFINWNNKAEKIHNLIRGLSPKPAAYTYLQNKTFKIYTSKFIVEAHNTEAGQYETDGKTYFRFATADGWLYCEEVQTEGKKKMNISDFLRGYRALEKE